MPLVLSQGKVLLRNNSLAVADEPCLCCGEPCDAAVSSGGGLETTRYHKMPREAGKVTFKYTAFNLKDTFVVSSEDGSEVFVDTGLISGSGEATFCKPEGMKRVMVRVTGEDYGTVWNYSISCPEPPCDEPPEPCTPVDLDKVDAELSSVPGGSFADYPVSSSGPIRVEFRADSQPGVQYDLKIFFDFTVAYDSGPVTGASVILDKPAGQRLGYELRRIPSSSTGWTYRLRISCPPGTRVAGGPGSELTRLLNRFWVRYQPGCKCQDRAARMDDMGPEWCRENEDLILSWLEEEARRRGIPYIHSLAKMVLEAAISRAESRLSG